MNNPNPLIPQGSLQQQPRGRSNIRVAVFLIVAIHAVLFGGILMQGCKRDTKTAKSNQPTNTLPQIDTNIYYTNYDQIAAPITNPPSITPAVPQTREPATSPSPLEGKEYTIVRGDTYSGIAKANHTTIAALAKANPGVDPNRLRLNQKIIIPPPAPAASAPNSDPNIHVVKPGENLTKIAKQHGTTAKAIKALNNLRTDRVVVDQKLKLPPPDAGGLPPALPSQPTNVSPLSTGNTGASIR